MLRILHLVAFLCLAMTAPAAIIPGATLSATTNAPATDTTHHTIDLYPLPADNWPQMQNAVNYCINNPGWKIRLAAPGDYSISKPIIIARLTGSDYAQVSVDIEGLRDAQNAPANTVSRIISRNPKTPAIIIQKGKTCHISNIGFVGPYNLPNSLSPAQIDVLPWEGWSDGVCSDGRTNPNAAIVIDPFSRSEFIDGKLYQQYEGLQRYYLPEMGFGGSTDIKISGCNISNFVAGIVITPSFQLNGEMIAMTDLQISYCRAAICWTQAQSKANSIRNFMCWGNTNTIFDGVHFGRWRGDGSTAPFIDGVNIAGINYQLIQAFSYAFPLSISHVYAEGLFKIGSAGGYAETHFADCQLDLQGAQPGLPQPDFYYSGAATRWTSCMIRLYGDTLHRIILNSNLNFFEGGTQGIPPVCIGNPSPPVFHNVIMFYGRGVLNSNNYDTLISMGSNLIRVNPDFTGSFVSGSPATYHVGDLLLTMTNNQGGRVPLFMKEILNNQHTLAFVSRVAGNTVYLQNIAVGIQDNVATPVIIARLKQGFRF